MTVKTIFLLDSDVISDLLGLQRDPGWLVVERPTTGSDRFFVTGNQKPQQVDFEAADRHRAVRLEVTALQRRTTAANVLASRPVAANRVHDVLISATTAVTGAVLVTRDSALLARAIAAGITVWNTDTLTAYLTRSQLPALRVPWPADAAKASHTRSLRPTGS